MFIDTHCHINMMVKKTFDTPLDDQQIHNAHSIIEEAKNNDVKIIIDIGTGLIESKNCVALAKHFEPLFATVGIHPNDCTASWRADLDELKKLLKHKSHNKIVGIGECGIDLHYPEYNVSRQQDAFKAQIELALEHDLALVVHSRDAADETLRILDEYKNDIKRSVMHCFSYDRLIAREAIAMGFLLGIDGPITYPKNDELRAIVLEVGLKHIVLETDAPFLPPQQFRGQQNHPKYIKTIAEFIAQFFKQSLQDIAQQTTDNARKLFLLNN
ncbi:MAG: TatD family hydrolase [bacterium]|nr:TatD family hydrolase [bacterium]